MVFYNAYLYNFVFIENKASSYLQIGLDPEKIISHVKTFYCLKQFLSGILEYMLWKPLVCAQTLL